MRVLIACEFSGIVREAFRARGHDAWSCDLRGSEDGSPHHIQGDAMEAVKQNWDVLIAHPPCTHLSLSGARWLTDHWIKRKNKPDKWHDGSAKRAAQKLAVEFFRALLHCDIPMRCIENPMSMASTLVAPKSQTIHPWQFGHPEQKTTWLWLRNLPALQPTKIVYEEMMKLPKNQRERINFMPPDRNAKRSAAEPSGALLMRWPRNGAKDAPCVHPVRRAGPFGESPERAGPSVFLKLMKHRRPPLPDSMKQKPVPGRCRWCGGAILSSTGAATRRTWHPECVAAYREIFWPAVTRKAVWERDHGVCGACGLDTCASMRQQFLNDYGQEGFRIYWPVRGLKMSGDLWQADHIVALVNADRSSLDHWRLPNLQTLCTACHRAKTQADVRQARAR